VFPVEFKRAVWFPVKPCEAFYVVVKSCLHVFLL
jgi:hypothetical protein